MHALTRRISPYLLAALAIALVYHGALIFFTFRRTYDAYVHIFFADHYARSWFEPWDYRWYTGFTLTSYPPGSQQVMALISKVTGLQNAFIIVQTFAVLLVVVGVYRFARIWVSEEAAGYSCLLAVFASSITETVHVFGQLPTMFSLGFLLNALAYVYAWVQQGGWKMLLCAWLCNAATTAAHHVTTLFGAVFFVAPVILLVIVENFRKPLPDESPEHPRKFTRKNARALISRRLRRIMPTLTRAAIYLPGLVITLFVVVLPYWLWSKSDPITQVPIPHASRDSFIVNINAGIVFWIIPYGVTLIALPYVFYKGLTTRAWPMALSFCLCFLLGTGGTTPIPKLLLGGAYDIVTLDRFTFWATILMLPILGQFVVSLRHGGLAKYLKEQFGRRVWTGIQIALVICYLLMSQLVTNFTQFRKMEPDPINMQPIVTFLGKDDHARWRYLTLGFGDQMAWLSAQTTATTVDGNYHSARRLPELTSTPIERLEGAKFRGIPGIGSLQQFLAVPDKYNLKFVFSNDQFYDPLLYFSGWHQLQRLENGIMVWEREDIPPLPEVLPFKDIPTYQKLMWGIIPIASIILALIVMCGPVWWPLLRKLLKFLGVYKLLLKLVGLMLKLLKPFHKIGNWADARLLKWSALPPGDLRESPGQSRWQIWHGWLSRIPRPRPASLARKYMQAILLFLLVFGGIGTAIYMLLKSSSEPTAVVQTYYDDLDFRRFSDAYALLDPGTRPAFDLYNLQLSVKNGLVASYGKLDSVKTTVLTSEPDRVVIQADVIWITSVNDYATTDRLTLIKSAGHWYITPDPQDMTTPPDQFFAQASVDWHSQGRRVVTTDKTTFGDVLDRPQLQVLSARLVKVGSRYSVVGELLNTDDNPADLTVAGVLYDKDGKELTQYNAQSAMIHKLFPKEITPFRVDFEGVAGTVLSDTVTASDFAPGAFSPVQLESPVASFEVYAKGVVTSHDLDRDVEAQNIQVKLGTDSQNHITGELLNYGAKDATIPHILVTYYDKDNRVMWVDQAYIAEGIRSQREEAFDVTITAPTGVQTILDKGDLFANSLGAGVASDPNWGERIPLPAGFGYASFRLSVNYFTGAAP